MSDNRYTRESIRSHELGEILWRIVLGFLWMLAIASLLAALLFIMSLATVRPQVAHAKGMVDPTTVQPSPDDQWLTHDTSGEYRPRWMMVCVSRLTVWNDPDAAPEDRTAMGQLRQGDRILAAELANGFTLAYVEQGWVVSQALCPTWQPSGW